jgi:hypothetical protein
MAWHVPLLAAGRADEARRQPSRVIEDNPLCQMWRLRGSAPSLDRSIMTIAPLDSLDERIRRAIAEKRLLEIRYKNAIRLVERHDYGVIDGTERLLIFQLNGPDSGKGAVGWRLLDVVKIESCLVTEQTFAAVASHTSSITSGSGCTRE